MRSHNEHFINCDFLLKAIIRRWFEVNVLEGYGGATRSAVAVAVGLHVFCAKRS